jgi:hypothetical protein
LTGGKKEKDLRFRKSLGVEPTGIEPVTTPTQASSVRNVTETAVPPLAHSLARESEKCPSDVALDSDLTRILDAWPTLPPAIRAGILAMIEAARNSR